MAEHSRPKRGSARVYIDTSSTESSSSSSLAVAVAVDPVRRLSPVRLSHDISTEQLFSDQLIDGKVADGEGDDDEEEEDGEKKEKHPAEVMLEEHEEPDSDALSRRARSPKRSSSRKKEEPTAPRKSRRSTSRTSDATAMKTGSGMGSALYRIESHSHLSSLDAALMEPPPPASSSAAASQSTQPQPKPRVSLNRLQRRASNSSAGGIPATTHGVGTQATNVPTGQVAEVSSKATVIPSSSASSSPSTVCINCTTNRKMPPMHCAAYAGHLACLEWLLTEHEASTTVAEDITRDDTTTTAIRPMHLDRKKRTPLFYACAANRLECCSLLLRLRPAWRDLPDKQADTPVHVCCFFGWHECLSRLLDAGANPHGRNAKGFKPSHIAKTRECLELLLSFGDDLLQGDKVGRTPLFVACARDRTVSVEFLCAWNHQSRSWMLEQEDQRGDRPLHAAACNGSEVSLAILLRYGADPTTRNAQGMTPKDLALTNNHPRCVELLTQAETELSSAETWFAPANAVTADNSGDGHSVGDPLASAGWIECWDDSSGQPFYYDNVSGKCQWDVPAGFEPKLLAALASQQHQQQQQQSEEDDGEYVWVKKKRQTVCVVTAKESEWSAVQDPASKAIYYKNTRTGQSQWEEPDAVQRLQSASGAQASQHASRIWDELEASRSALARALALDKQRQWKAHLATLEAQKQSIRQRRDDIRKKEEQAKLQQLMPRSSFIRRKKQSMMIKIKGGNANSNGRVQEEEEDRMELICQREPSLDIFLSTFLRLHGVRDLRLSIEKRFFNCLYHYYVALVDPVHMAGMSKSQFRTVLRDAGVIPSSFTISNNNALHRGNNQLPHSSNSAPTLKLHIVDLIYAQAGRNEASTLASASSLAASTSMLGPMIPSISGTTVPHSASHTSLGQHPLGHVRNTSAISGDSHLGLLGFTVAMQIVRERVVTLAEEQGDSPQEIDDEEEWFLTTYLLPLTVRLGGKMLSQIRECKERDLELTACGAVQGLLTENRHAIQRLHRFYSSQEPTSKMLTFFGLSRFAQDFAITQHVNLTALHHLYEAVNWISGHAHTEIISFEKFQQLLTLLALQLHLQLEQKQSRTNDSALQPLGGAAQKSSADISASNLVVGDGIAQSIPTGTPESVLSRSIISFLSRLNSSPAVHRIPSEGVDNTNAGVPSSSLFVLPTVVE